MQKYDARLAIGDKVVAGKDSLFPEDIDGERHWFDYSKGDCTIAAVTFRAGKVFYTVALPSGKERLFDSCDIEPVLVSRFAVGDEVIVDNPPAHPAMKGTVIKVNFSCWYNRIGDEIYHVDVGGGYQTSASAANTHLPEDYQAVEYPNGKADSPEVVDGGEYFARLIGQHKAKTAENSQA